MLFKQFNQPDLKESEKHFFPDPGSTIIIKIFLFELREIFLCPARLEQ